jgi:D-alanyl-D-alanine carboxypeptidase
MITKSKRVIVAALVAAQAACTSIPSDGESSPPVGSTVAPPASTTVVAPSTAATVPGEPFPTATFAAIREQPVSEELAAQFQAALEDLAARDEFSEGGGLTATVMTADGTWSGVVGKADDVRDLQVDDQFAIASITKSMIAAQVMSMVEAGELGLDDLVADHLPRDLQFDTNGATIRDLLSHRSGIPDDYDVIHETLQSDPLRVWTPADVLEQIPTRRGFAGRSFEYSGTNYLLLGLVIDHERGRPVVEVLRAGVLAIDGIERLVFQPDEKPTEPMAMPRGQSTALLELGGGYLPSLAAASAFPEAGGIASDSPSLARWWQAFCAGEIVSQATLTEMSAFDPDVSVFDGGYGLGLNNPTYGHASAVGHGGELFGYMSWAACLPEEGAVIVVLSNRVVHSITIELLFGALAPFADVLHSR